MKKLKEDKSFWSLILFNFSIIAWVVFVWLLMFYYDKSFVIWFVRLTFVSASIAVVSFIVFVRYSIKKRHDFFTRLVVFLSFPVVLLSLSEYLVKDVGFVESSRFVPVVFDDAAIFFVLYFIFAVMTLLVSFVEEKDKIKGLESLRLKYVAVGMALGGIIALFTNVIIPFFTGQSDTAQYGPLAISSISILTTYSFVGKRLFGIKFVISKVFFYITMILMPFSFIYLSLILYEILWGYRHTYETSLLFLLLSVIFVTVFSRAKDILEDRIFPSWAFKDFNPNQEREKFNREISTKLDIDKIGIYTILSFSKMYGLEKLGIVLFDKEMAKVMYKYLKGVDENRFSMRDLLQVIFYWDELEHSTVIVRNELMLQPRRNQRLNRILEFMNANDIEVILPLNRKVQLNGVILLGARENGRSYTMEEISFLESLILNLSVTFGRAILYHQVQEFNKTLQSKVNEQTKELQMKVKQLQEARKKEADMIDIMGHELRTPATVVKLNAELLEQFTDDVLNDRDKFELYIKRIKTAVENEIKLINTLLSSAKLEGDKIELNLEEVNIHEDIEMAIHGHEIDATQKGLELMDETTKDTPSVYADHARVIEVLNNLVDNAIKYTHKGSVRVKSSYDDDTVSISVVDTGQGIAQDELEKLGQKFYRIENYINEKEGKPDLVRPGGTGLGLYVTFGLIKKMGGDIKVNSEIDKGTDFTFTLPRYKGQNNGNKKSDSKDMFERLGLKRSTKTI
jgi:signal transduction histidine kinase